MTRAAHPSRRWFSAGAAGLVLLATLAGCTGKPQQRPRDQHLPPLALRLVAFDSCADLLKGLRTAAKAAVGPYGLNAPPMATAAGGAERAQPAAPGAPAAGADAQKAAPGNAPDAAPDAHSTTNTHEPGVDEPDLVKTDGKRIVTIQGGILRVIDPAGRRVTGSLRLSDAYGGPDGYGVGAAQLLISGDRALVLLAGTGGYATTDSTPLGGVRKPAPTPQSPTEPVGPRLIAVDLSGEPRVTGQFSVDGALVDARQVGATVRVVVRSAPRTAFPYDQTGGEGPGSEGRRVAANQAIIDKAPVEDWLPRYSLDDATGHRTGRVDCTAVSRPAKYTGASMLTVLTFDLAKPTLGAGDPVSVVADGETVYSNGPSLYIADNQTRDLPRMPERTGTDLYKFDTAGPGRPRFVAAGSVPGYLLNQYSLSEFNGSLRVATTSAQPWQTQRATAIRSESAVYVLRQQGGTLVETGHVGGLGKGERIYAVRFLGGDGYVVTFRQTDPLYTLDLRDPARPRVVGELKINGYSAYLHPAGDGRLLGIGQEATNQGRTQGTQVSLFDVANPERPNRIAQYHVKWGISEAEFQPHAFLYWPATRLLVVPLNRPQASRSSTAGGSGALALRVDDAGFADLGMVTHPGAGGADYGGPIRRSLVIGDSLWTVSDIGLAANDTRSLARQAWVPFS